MGYKIFSLAINVGLYTQTLRNGEDVRYNAGQGRGRGGRGGLKLLGVHPVCTCLCINMFKKACHEMRAACVREYVKSFLICEGSTAVVLILDKGELSSMKGSKI